MPPRGVTKRHVRAKLHQTERMPGLHVYFVLHLWKLVAVAVASPFSQPRSFCHRILHPNPVDLPVVGRRARSC